MAPPANVLMHCVHILDEASTSKVTEKSLADLVKQRLGGRDKAEARAAIARLILTLVP